MLKITQTVGASDVVTLKLEGRVIGPWVEELRLTCESHVREGRRLSLDLSEVTFADAQGFDELARLRSLDATLCGCTPFLEEQLKSR